MSIRIMSAIFETEFPDYLSFGELRTKASTAKLLLLAIADHANDEGESAYPGFTRLERKTGLSRQGIIDTLKVLKYNGLIVVADEPSKLGTNNYTIYKGAFPCLMDDAEKVSQGTLLVKPLYQGSQATLPEVVKPLDLKHSLITIESPLQRKISIPEGSDIGWMVAGGVPSEEIARQQLKEKQSKEITDLYEREMGYNPLPWGKLEPLKKFLLTKTPDEIHTFAVWSKGKFSPLNPSKARQFPDLVRELWPQSEPQVVESLAHTL